MNDYWSLWMQSSYDEKGGDETGLQFVEVGMQQQCGVAWRLAVGSPYICVSLHV